MGFLDRLLGKPARPATRPPAAPVAPATTTPEPPVEPSAEVAPAPVPGGGLLGQLQEARARLDAQDLGGAVALYEQILAAAGDRPDVLTTISGDLGVTGNVQSIIELIAPRYDAQRHGPATGINLLQAYLAVRNTGAAQHVLDLLFALQRPDLEERLWGFSNALADLIEAERTGAGGIVRGGPAPAGAETIGLATISRPIWSYGLEALPGLLPAKDGQLRRIAFAQVAQPGLTDARERSARPEDATGRLARGLALWLADAFYFSPVYQPIAAVAQASQHYALFPGEWTIENIRQLVQTCGDRPDYVVTGALREKDGDHELLLRIWEVRKMRERKQLTARWTPATAAAALTTLREDLGRYMEWGTAPAPAALAWKPAPDPLAWAHALGTSLTLFLGEKGVLAPDQLTTAATELPSLAQQASHGELASLAWLTAAARAQALGLPLPAGETALADTPLVAQAAALLAP